MSTRYGALTLDVPAGYDDETIIILKAPTPAPSVRMRAPTGEIRRPTLVVRRVPLISDVDLADLVAVEERTLAATVPGAAIGPTSSRTVAGLPALVREVALPAPDGSLRQLHVSLKSAGALYLFIGTHVDDVSFADARATFMSIIESARIAP